MTIRLNALKSMALALIPCLTVMAQAQTPGTRLTVDVKVDSISLRGDTTRVSYVLSNRTQSQDSLFIFIVDAPARVSYVSRPQPDTVWMVDSLLRESQPAAFWSKLDLLAPSASTPLLFFDSPGLPGIVTTWVEGHWPISTCCDEDVPDSTQDVLVTRTVQGKTVGVEPWPADRSAQALLLRLRNLTQSICATPLSWITNAALCGTLLNDLDAAEGYRASGDATQAQASLDHYKSLLAGPDPGTFASGVNSAAFWMLRSNADIVKATL